MLPLFQILSASTSSVDGWKVVLFMILLLVFLIGNFKEDQKGSQTPH